MVHQKNLSIGVMGCNRVVGVSLSTAPGKVESGRQLGGSQNFWFFPELRFKETLRRPE